MVAIVIILSYFIVVIACVCRHNLHSTLSKNPQSIVHGIKYDKIITIAFQAFHNDNLPMVQAFQTAPDSVALFIDGENLSPAVLRPMLKARKLETLSLSCPMIFLANGVNV